MTLIEVSKHTHTSAYTVSGQVFKHFKGWFSMKNKIADYDYKNNTKEDILRNVVGCFIQWESVRSETVWLPTFLKISSIFDLQNKVIQMLVRHDVNDWLCSEWRTHLLLTAQFTVHIAYYFFFF